MAFDIEEDGQLVSDAFAHCLLQSRDLLSTELVPVDDRRVFNVKPKLLLFHMVSDREHTSACGEEQHLVSSAGQTAFC